MNLLEADRELESSCPHHKFCAEGRCNLNYASKVIGVDHHDLAKFPTHPVWRRIGHYIAQLCTNIFLLTSVEKIVIGGGLANNPYLLDFVTNDFDSILNNYVRIDLERPGGKHSIIVPAMKNNAVELFGAVMCTEN